MIILYYPRGSECLIIVVESGELDNLSTALVSSDPKVSRIFKDGSK